MIDKPITEIREQDISQLVATSVMESKRIEYKKILELNSVPGKGASREDPKRKFLSWIAAFANGSGGDIVFGIEAKDGKPQQVVPLQGFNEDSMVLQLQQLIRAHIEPAVFGIEFRAIPIDGGHVFVLRIPKSYVGVHMVTYAGDDHFYVRAANGCVRMDIDEIRNAFTLVESFADRMRKWRAERIANILSDETPRQLAKDPRLVLHVMPLSAFSNTFKADLRRIQRDTENLNPINAHHAVATLDFDGVVSSHSADSSNFNGKVFAYTLVFRNGCIEGVDSFLLSAYPGAEKFYPGVVGECRLKEFLERSINILKKLGCESPLFIGLSMLNVRGFTMEPDPLRRSIYNRNINRDHLIAPEVFVENLDFNTGEVLREPFYMFWNACGYQRSWNYNDNDQWSPGR